VILFTAGLAALTAAAAGIPRGMAMERGDAGPLFISPRIPDASWKPSFSPFSGEGAGSGMEARIPGLAAGSVPDSGDRWFARDKARHLVVSFLAAGAAGYVSRHGRERGRTEAAQWGFGASVSAGVLKEIFDLRNLRAQSSLKDLGADLAGAACGALLLSWW